MSASFPATIKNYLQLQDGVDKVIAQHPNERGDEITAIETLIGALGSGQSYHESLKNLIKDYRHNCNVVYKGVATITVQPGCLAIPDASGNIRWRRNTADVDATWTNLDTGAEANVKYYVYAVADSAATTFTVKISTSASAPSGCTYYRLIGEFTNNTDILPASVTSVNFSGSESLSAWFDKSADYGAQLAPTDGYVLATVYDASRATGYTDANTNPTTIRARAYAVASEYAELFMPVRKGDYWKLTIAGGSVDSIWWVAPRN